MRHDRRSKITFLVKGIVQDDYGDSVDGWVPFKADVYASKKPILGNEYFTALTTDTKVEVKFNVRYFSGVTNLMRIQHDTKVYEILSAIDVEDLHREILCYCKLVV